MTCDEVLIDGIKRIWAARVNNPHLFRAVGDGVPSRRRIDK
jgi:hypothetical protein